MPSLELVPYSELDPNAASLKIFDLLQEQDTAAQIAQFLPKFFANYGLNSEVGARRFSAMAALANKVPGFLPMAQVFGGEIIGTATIDDRLNVYRRLDTAKHLTELPLIGPSTSSWIAAPFQGQGLGKDSLEQRMRMATEQMQFSGLWLKVMDANVRSRQNVLARGFELAYQPPLYVSGVLFEHSSIYQYLAGGPSNKEA